MITRSKTLTMAAILQILLGLVDMIGALRILAAGTARVYPLCLASKTRVVLHSGLAFFS